MIKLTPSTIDDLEQIQEWIALDPYHQNEKKLKADWWLTGAKGSLLDFCLQDDNGPTCYVRLEKENDLTRLHTQFAPEEVVSKRRLVMSMLEAFKMTIPYLKSINMKGIIFESTSPSLIAFMEKQGFKHVSGDDYLLMFEDK